MSNWIVAPPFRRSRGLNFLAALLLIAACAPPTAPAASVQPGASGADASATGHVDAPASMVELIEAAEQSGALDYDTALVYRLYAALDVPSLPPQYRSESRDAPEATTILAQLAGRLDDLAPDLRASVEPFLMRPTEPDSFWARPSAAQGAAAHPIALAGGAAAAVPEYAIEYGYVDVVAPTPIRVWHALPLGETERQLAERLATEIHTSDMWARISKAMLGRKPCGDLEQGEHRNGGSAALDVYLIYPSTGLDWNRRTTNLTSPRGTTALGVTVPAESGAKCPWITYIALNATLGFDSLRSTMAHELFHSFQFAFKGTELADRDWWMEASATWAEDLVYPLLDIEQPALETYWSHVLGAGGPLDRTDGTAAYATYLWAFYLRQKAGGDEAEIGRLWEQTEKKAPLAVMGDMAGWADKFKEFALWNWNKDPLVDYADAGRPISSDVLAQNSGCLKESCVIKLGRQDLYLDMQHTSVEYYKGGPEIDVEQLRFELGDFAGKAGAGLQAIITIGNPGSSQRIQTEDWSDLDERVFCTAREDVREVVLVVTNSGVVPGQKLQGKIGIEALPDHCGGGTASFTQTTSSSSAGEAICGVSSTTEQSSSLTMVVTWDEDGQGTATLNQQHNSTEVSQDVLCGDGSVQTKTVSASVSGTKPTEVTWSISDDGMIDFYAGWDFIGGGARVTTTTCTVVACDWTVTEEYGSEYDALYFTAEGDPSAPVITGSFTEDNSGDGYTDVIVYSWTMER